MAPKYNSKINTAPTHFQYFFGLKEYSANTPTKRIEDNRYIKKASSPGKTELNNLKINPTTTKFTSKGSLFLTSRLTFWILGVKIRVLNTCIPAKKHKKPGIAIE